MRGLWRQDPYLNVFNAVLKTADAVAEFSKWLKRLPAASLSGAIASALPKIPPARKVPPFDIQDVPKAMRKLHMPMAAKLQERWFAGQENYSLNSDDLRNEIDQNGLRYSSAMVDSTTIKIAFDNLVVRQIRNPEALSALKKLLTPYRARSEILAWNLAKSDFLYFHKKFQFQFQKVNATWRWHSRRLDRSTRSF